MNKNKRILFVDFNGVISYDPFWASLQNRNHPLHSFFNSIEELLFKGENKIEGLVDDWMLGRYTSEEVHKIIAQKLNAPYKLLIDTFVNDCKHIDISVPILNAIQNLRNNWYCILRTDNMDSFHRFTLPSNPQLAESCDAIHSSYLLGQLKKTENGKYFITTSFNLRVDINNCVLIDDSESVCAVFYALGGLAYRTQNEKEVVNVLENLNSYKI